MNKTTQLKQLLHAGQIEFLMEAHSGLSAKIVQEAGFRGIWGRGLSISAALGVRDNNEASWTQVLEVVEFMSDVTGILMTNHLIGQLHSGQRNTTEGFQQRKG